MAGIREVSILSIISQIDPGWQKESENPIEYEFSNNRKFRGRYKQRGPYAADMED